MGRLNVISLDMKDVEIEKISEIDFEKLKSDLELLAKQPPVEVWPCYKNEEIDYDIGYRSISVDIKFREGRPDFVYRVADRADVRNSVNHGDFVGRRSYSQSEVDKLRE